MCRDSARGVPALESLNLPAPWARTVVARGPPRGIPGYPEVSPGLCASPGAASGARSPDGILRRGPGLSGPGIHLERPRDAPRSLPDSVHCLGSFLCTARGHRRSSPCLSNVTGGISGGAPPTIHCQTTGRDRGGEAPCSGRRAIREHASS
jgi:hypothetical protein